MTHRKTHDRDRPSLPKGTAFRAAAGVVVATMLMVALPARPAWVEDTSPCLNKGCKWRIAYYEGGPWTDYKDTLLATVGALMDLGWITPAPLPRFDDPADTAQVWRWLSTQARSDYLEFSNDAFFSADWKDNLRSENQGRILEALALGRFDLVWALGTWAGLDLVNNGHQVPTMVMSASNPVTAGIISDPKDSGHDHVHVRTDPAYVFRQVLLFHDVFDFKRLGLIYEDTDYGRAYAYLGEVEAAAERAGFELVTCQATERNLDLEQAMEKYVACARRLAPMVDAFIYDDHIGGDPSNVARTLPIFVSFGVPTWSTRGSPLVQRGVLISLAKHDFTQAGGFHARTMAQILNGARPRDLEQIFQASFRLAINLKTAELIGYDPPPNLIRVTDDVFTAIEPPWEQAHEQ